VVGKLSTWQKGISSPGKNDKRKRGQKVGLKKWNLKALEKEGTKASLLGPPRTGKLASDLLKKELQKKKVMRNEGGTSHQCC